MGQTKKIVYYVISGLMIISMASCVNFKKYEQDEAAEIQKYLNDNPALNFELKPSGLYYLEITPGIGLPPSTHDTAFVFFSEKFLDGTIIFNTLVTEDTMAFPVNEGNLIPGFDEGITCMRAGGESLFLVPSKLAYGTTGDYSTISGYTPLLFDVKLLRIRRGSGEK